MIIGRGSWGGGFSLGLWLEVRGGSLVLLVGRCDISLFYNVFENVFFVVKWRLFVTFFYLGRCCFNC